MVANKLKIKKGDEVVVITGKDRGKRGKITRVIPRKQLIVIEGVNIGHKHRKARKAGEKSQIVSRPFPIQASNALLFCGHCGRGRRVRINSDDKVKRRICTHCQKPL